MAVGEVRTERGEGLRAGTDVVVDDVEDHRDAHRVGGVDEPGEAVWSAVRGVRSGRVHTVVAPAAVARERRDRHHLDRGHAEADEVVELADHGVEGAAAGEGADVQLVDDEVREGHARPTVVAPAERAGVEDAGRAADAVRLPPRARVGERTGSVEHEPVVGAGREREDAREDAVRAALQLAIATFTGSVVGADRPDRERRRVGRPDPELGGLRTHRAGAIPRHHHGRCSPRLADPGGA